MTDPSHALEVDIAKLQLKLEALEERLSRIDMYGTQEVGKMEAKIAVLETNLKALIETISEVRGDVKALLTFRALLFGGAAVVSVIISVIVNVAGRWFRG